MNLVVRHHVYIFTRWNVRGKIENETKLKEKKIQRTWPRCPQWWLNKRFVSLFEFFQISMMGLKGQLQDWLYFSFTCSPRACQTWVWYLLHCYRNTHLYLPAASTDPGMLRSLQECLWDVKSWMSENLLQLFLSTTEVLVIQSQHMTREIQLHIESADTLFVTPCQAPLKYILVFCLMVSTFWAAAHEACSLVFYFST